MPPWLVALGIGGAALFLSGRGGGSGVLGALAKYGGNAAGSIGNLGRSTGDLAQQAINAFADEISGIPGGVSTQPAAVLGPATIAATEALEPDSVFATTFMDVRQSVFAMPTLFVPTLPSANTVLKGNDAERFQSTVNENFESVVSEISKALSVREPAKEFDFSVDITHGDFQFD